MRTNRKQNSITKWIKRQGVCTTEKKNLELPPHPSFFFVLFCFSLCLWGFLGPYRSFKRNRAWCVGTSAQFSSSRSLFASTEHARVTLSWAGQGEDFIVGTQSGKIANLPPKSKDSSAIAAASCCALASCHDYQQNWAEFGLHAFLSLARSSMWSPADTVHAGLYPRQLLGHLKWGQDAKAESGSKGDWEDLFWKPDFPFSCLSYQVQWKHVGWGGLHSLAPSVQLFPLQFLQRFIQSSLLQTWADQGCGTDLG